VDGFAVTIAVDQPTYFMKVFGITTMPTGAVATAVYRPRDTAFVLDMTGSMAYASTMNFNGASQNPDNLVPKFGHYQAIQSKLIATSNQANGNGEAISMNNFCITTPGGPPIVRDFYFDPVNSTNPKTVAFPVNSSSGNLKNAFHRWSPPESGGDSTSYTPPTYTFTGYNAFDLGNGATSNGPTPAPDTFKTMTDSGGITYVGDRWRRADGSINKTDTTWATGSATTKAAGTAIELLGYNVSGTNVRGGTSGSTTITTIDKFRDEVWEKYGYDLNIVQYRTDKGNNAPKVLASYTAPQVPAADKFVGYSMGPGYWGKTFYVWPPDPRTPVNDPGVAGYVAGDWRQRYFQKRDGTAFAPQADNNPSTGSVAEGINQVLLNTTSGQMLPAAIGSTSSPNWKINYTAVLKWIKSGPQTLPPNLRAGRVLYYSSIPDDVDSTTGSTQEKLDKVFWKNYIDYTLNWNNTSNAYMYGYGDNWSGGALSVYTTGALSQWQGPSSLFAANLKPYMAYNDAPNRPRLHFWFGPLSMMDFLGKLDNWLPGTSHEAQCWQLKAGMNSVIDDLRNNRPNDYLGMVMFACTGYNGPRVEIGQNYQALKNALFYPKSLLDLINAGDTTSEFRPYDINFASTNSATIPNANGSTDPNTGLAYGFNILAPSSLTSTATATNGGYGTLKGRRGASKVVIFETDGVPNDYRGLSSGTPTMNPTLKGYETYYPTSGWAASQQANGDATCMNEAYKIVKQIVKPMATVGKTSSLDSGLSLPNAPARVYPIGFGDIFDPVLSPSATFRPTAKQFLANIAYWGNTGPNGATTLPDLQIITGPYDQRISRLKSALEQIFETGVSVALVE